MKAFKALVGIILLWSLSQTAFASEKGMEKFYIHVNNTVLECACADNSSSRVLLEKLEVADVEIQMSDYGNFEKVGELGFELPQNNEEISTEAGDVILYLGHSFVIYYAQNRWSLTRIGKIRGRSAQELKEILGRDGVLIRLSLKD